MSDVHSVSVLLMFIVYVLYIIVNLYARPYCHEVIFTVCTISKIIYNYINPFVAGQESDTVASAWYFETESNVHNFKCLLTL